MQRPALSCAMDVLCIDQQFVYARLLKVRACQLRCKSMQMLHHQQPAYAHGLMCWSSAEAHLSTHSR